MELDYPARRPADHPPQRVDLRGPCRNSACPRVAICALWRMYLRPGGRDAGYHEPTRGDAAADLEFERVAADWNGDVAAGRCRGFDAVVGDPARRDDHRAGLLNRTVNEAIAAHDGVRPLEQGEGDSFVAAFARASDAVACALALQRAPLAPIRLRIGIHTGEIQLRDDANYAGPTINRTARLRDLAHGGQTVLSGVTESLVADRMPEGVWLTELGSYPLRGVPRPERVVQLCHHDLRNEFPPLRVRQSVASHNLPAQLTSFVGRQAANGGLAPDPHRQPTSHVDRRRGSGQDAPCRRSRRATRHRRSPTACGTSISHRSPILLSCR